MEKLTLTETAFYAAALNSCRGHPHVGTKSQETVIKSQESTAAFMLASPVSRSSLALRSSKPHASVIPQDRFSQISRE
ncbi:hypothetical protein [Bradyrhizobium sp. UFLA05-112]